MRENTTLLETCLFSVCKRIRYQNAKKQGKNHTWENKTLQKSLFIVLSYLHTKTQRRMQNTFYGETAKRVFLMF